MEQIVPVYRGKPQAEKLMFMYADTYYKLEDYYLSGYQFERFAASYPKSDSVETAAYYSASSYYELSPVYSLDQKDTYTGLEKLQAFIDTYPNSEYRKEANKKVFSVAFSHDGNFVASSLGDGSIMLFNRKMELLKKIQVDNTDVTSIAFSPDDKTLASATSLNIKLWDISCLIKCGEN